MWDLEFLIFGFNIKNVDVIYYDFMSKDYKVVSCLLLDVFKLDDCC